MYEGEKMKTKLINLEYLINYGTKITIYFVNTGKIKETTAPNYGPNMEKEVISISPINKGHLWISIK